MENILKNSKHFLFTNKKFLLIIGVVVLAVLLFSGATEYIVGFNDKKQETSHITPSLSVPSSAPSSTPKFTPTLIPTTIPTATKTPLPTATPSLPSITPTPTPVPEDPTKGAIRIKLLDDVSKQPLSNVSSVNTTIKKGDFSATKSGAEVYFDNLTAGEEYQVYVDYVYGYNHVGSSCGSDCYLIDGAPGACSRKLPARVPSANQEIKCYYKSLN